MQELPLTQEENRTLLEDLALCSINLMEEWVDDLKDQLNQLAMEDLLNFIFSLQGQFRKKEK
ncbi:MAG: hypothetical protein HWN67_16855 [Candidatus Helarchaeota archaeon]|nr:hypothetical protein [Candidatus Helarchaeota archaeon]